MKRKLRYKDGYPYILKMWVVIHMPGAVERLELIQNLEKKMGEPIHFFKALTGDAWMNTPTTAKRHPYPPHNLIRSGDVGCTNSHIEILREAKARGDESIGIFEDDCELFFGAKEFLQAAAAQYPAADLILLGASEYVDSAALSPAYARVTRFWGTHAVFVRKRAFDAILKTYTDGLAAGTFYPADWLYTTAIKAHKLVAIGPANPRTYCQQKTGLVSLITGIVRR
jgi:GR25 family glycosyltransferase involved in LPS biosynthesis